MHRMVENVIHCPHLRNLACVHDRNFVAGFTQNRKVVGYENHSHVQFFSEFFQKLENLSLYHYIKCGSRFVAYDELRVARKRHCNHRPLLHAA